MHERIDPESVRTFMEGYYRSMRAAIEAHGGTLVKFLGDGVMAAFGVPRVAEDDASRAVHAGLDMQQAFRVLAREHAAIGLRVAINTGDVVLGESTRRLVAAQVTLEPLGSFALNGRGEQVKAWRVVSLEHPTGAAAAAFVGRDEELARITAVYDAAVAKPAARLAVVLGSPGLGKSRLIEEFVRRQGESARVLSADCDAAGSATFAPVAEALREVLHVEAGASADSVHAAIEGAVPGQNAERARIVPSIAARRRAGPHAGGRRRDRAPGRSLDRRRQPRGFGGLELEAQIAEAFELFQHADMKSWFPLILLKRAVTGWDDYARSIEA